ncbi:MAG: amidase family protein [Burkholderiaceae bacterium]
MSRPTPLPPLADLLGDFLSGARTPAQLVDACFATIDRLDASLNALPTRVAREAVREAAERAGEAIRAGQPVGPLAGLPYAAKDTHRTAGLRTTFGSPLFADHVPEANDGIVQHLLGAGAILIGKSNVPEFAAGAQTFNTVLGTTANPHDPTRTCGGSTGGGAVAVATGMAAIACGSDLGGSLRNPASFCGVAGLRPSSVAAPELQADNDRFNTLNTVDGMAPRVADLRWIHQAIHAPMPPRPLAQWLAVIAEAQAARQAAARRPLRLAWSIDVGGSMPVAAPVRQAIEHALDRLRRHPGIELVEASPDLSAADECFQVLRARHFVDNFGAFYRSDRSRIKDTVVWNIEQGLALTPERIGTALAQRSAIFARFADFLTGFDAWLLPTAQVLPFAHSQPFPTEIDGKPLATYIDWVKSCYWVTVSGHPALSIPAGFASDPADPAGTALPVGLQLVGRYRGDADLLDVGERVEAILA